MGTHRWFLEGRPKNSYLAGVMKSAQVAQLRQGLPASQDDLKALAATRRYLGEDVLLLAEELCRTELEDWTSLTFTKACGCQVNNLQAKQCRCGIEGVCGAAVIKLGRI
jgi:hypothetical protein